MQCAGRRLGVIALEFPAFSCLEQTHGWEVGDRFLAGVASCLKALKGRAYPENTLVAVEGVYGNAFTLFLRQGPGGREVAVTDLAEACGSLTAQMEARLAEAPW